MSKLKRDHWVAEHQLRKFTNSRGELFQLDLSTGEIRGVHPDEVECATGYDMPELEKIIQDIENDGARVTRTVLPTLRARLESTRIVSQLDDTVLNHYLRYVALSHLRTPKAHSLWSSVTGEWHARQSSGHPLHEIDRTARILRTTRDWLYMDSKGSAKFVLGDNPVQIVLRDGRLISGDRSIYDPTCDVFFPIGKHRCLIGSSDLDSFRRLKASDRHSLVNSAQILFADRHVYGSEPAELSQAWSWFQNRTTDVCRT